MDRLNEIEEELKKILVNFNKNKSRQYTNKTLQEKKETVEFLLNEAKALVTVPTDAETIKNIKDTYCRIRNTADSIQILIDTQIKEINNTRMASFDIKTATALLKPYDGNHEETEAFIESLELLDELTPADQKSTMIKFIKTRVSGKARYVITDEMTSVSLIKAKLRQKFTTKISSEAVLAQLKACRQGNKTLEDYALQMENLTRQLTKAYIHEDIATGEAAEKLAEKAAVHTFAKNISNPETSLILRAGNFTTVAEITTKAMAVDEPQANKVLHYNTRQQRDSRTNYFQGRNNAWNRNRYNRPGFAQQNNQWRQNNWNSGNHRNRYQNNNRNNQAPRSNIGNSYNNNSNNNRRINYCEAGEFQDPQPTAETVRLGAAQ